MDAFEPIRRKLKDFRPVSSDLVPGTTNLITKIRDPPPYMVQYLLVAVLGLDHGTSDKVWWQKYFSYRERIFKIRDYKFGSWTIEGSDPSTDGKKCAIEVQNRITSACVQLDKLMYPELKEQMKRGDYYIINAYNKLSEIFEFYLNKTRSAIRDHDSAVQELKSLSPPSLIPATKNSGATKSPIRTTNDWSFADYLNRVTQLQKMPLKNITNYCFALMTSFYSLTEFLLETIYAFEQTRAPLETFRKMEWNEKFKLLFPIATNNDLRWFYNQFIEIKRNYRNPLTHGLADETGRLVFLPYAGLVPMSYRYLSTKLNYDDVQIYKEDALAIIDTFTKFLDFMYRTEPYNYYMHYLMCRLPIPMNTKSILKLKSEMTTIDNFRDYMERHLRQQEAYENRDDYPW